MREPGRAGEKASAIDLTPRAAVACATPDDHAGMAWWNGLRKRERAEWLRRAGSARPVDAWRAFKQGVSPAMTADICPACRRRYLPLRGACSCQG